MISASSFVEQMMFEISHSSSWQVVRFKKMVRWSARIAAWPRRSFGQVTVACPWRRNRRGCWGIGIRWCIEWWLDPTKRHYIGKIKHHQGQNISWHAKIILKIFQKRMERYVPATQNSACFSYLSRGLVLEDRLQQFMRFLYLGLGFDFQGQPKWTCISTAFAAMSPFVGHLLPDLWIGDGRPCLATAPGLPCGESGGAQHAVRHPRLGRADLGGEVFWSQAKRSHRFISMPVSFLFQMHQCDSICILFRNMFHSCIASIRIQCQFVSIKKIKMVDLPWRSPCMDLEAPPAQHGRQLWKRLRSMAKSGLGLAQGWGLGASKEQ